MARYGDKYPSGVSRAEVEKVRDKFLSDIENAKFEGAVSDMPKFTSYMVRIPSIFFDSYGAVSGKHVVCSLRYRICLKAKLFGLNVNLL